MYTYLFKPGNEHPEAMKQADSKMKAIACI